MMKIIYTILSFLAVKANATTYYVSNAGSDAANGTTTGTAWQTISKVNGFAFAANDSILFKCGNSWNERLVPPRSTLYFGSYSTGVKPLLTGFQTATMIPVSGNVYESTVTSNVDSLNTVTINGKLGIKARYPNSTYLTFTSGTDSTLVTSLTGTPSYAGKEIVVRVAHWIIDRKTVSTQSTGTLNISPKLTYSVNPNTLGGNGYFFQNDISFLDSANEWCYSANNLKVYSTLTPTVQVSTIDTLVWVRQKNNITFNNISFTGANKTAFEIDTCSYITVQNCSINNSGTNGITAEKSHHLTASYDSVQNILNDGFYYGSKDPYNVMIDTCNNPTITNCYLKNIAIYPGMGGSGNEKYFGIHLSGDSCNITYNTIDSVGYIPLRWNGWNSTIGYNNISNYGFVKDDAGGIYSYIGNIYYSTYDTGSVIKYNIIRNGLSAPEGINSGASFGGGCNGIYMDNFVWGVTIIGNTCSNTTHASLGLNEAHYITVRENIFDDSTGYPVQAQGAADKLYSNTFKRNIYYQRKAANQVVYMLGVTPVAITASDSNYFLRPSDSTSSNFIGWRATNYGFPHLWQDSTGYDMHSSKSLSFIAGTVGTLVTNPTTQSIFVSIPAGTYIDVYNNCYRDNIELSPFGSALLFPSSLSLSKAMILQ